MVNYVILLIAFLSIQTFVNSATRCYGCSSAMNSQCTYVLNKEFPNHCSFEVDVKCALYTYKTNDKEVIVRGCKNTTETCKHIEDMLTKEHKTISNCTMCSENLCNDVFSTSEGSKVDKLSSHNIYILLITFCVFLVTRH
ncbi:uncharacterized protein LOC135132105 isoform X2 [Zophobas morio]|uniref:uncharacterized protein LOC135132105 isoform X2 n=1 Tax=Zophobas morio TaxID=2755281 RepID=UPI00308371BB